MARYTVDLPCTEDMYMNNDTPDVSYGTATTLLTGGVSRIWDPNVESISTWGYFEDITFMKFNFSQIPTNATITSAYLRLYSLNELKAKAENDNTVYIYPLDAVFAESETWRNIWERDFFRKEIGKSPVKVKVDTPLNKYVEIDILSTIYGTSLKNNGIGIFWANNDISGGINGDIWKVGARNSSNPPVIRVTYHDTVSEKPTIIEPVGLYVKNTQITQFKWQYNNSSGGIQNKFDLKWSTNGTTWTIVSQVTANNYYDMPANTLPTGNIYWKVITYNNLNEASPESDIGTFYAVGAPQTPVITGITNTNTPKPTVTWTSTSQQTYQVQILQGSNVIYDTGDIPSISVKSHTVTTFLGDETYTARVRVKNEYDLYSNWGTSNFTIITPKPVKPPIVLVVNKYSIDVTSNLADNSYLLLFRADINSSNFKCVVKSTSNTMKDFTVENNKLYKYFVRAVSKTGTYLDSDTKPITSAKINKSILSPVSTLSNIFEIKYNLNERPTKNLNISIPSTTNYFSGRQYPVVEYSEHLGCGITLSFFIKDDSEYQQLLNILYLKGIVLYRDGRRKFYGNISGINVTDNYFGYAVSLTINQTDYNEYLEV